MAANINKKSHAEQLFHLYAGGSLKKGNVKRCQVGNDNFVVYSEYFDGLYVMNKDRIGVFARCHQAIVDACLVRKEGEGEGEGEGWLLWTLTSQGIISCTSLQSLHPDSNRCETSMDDDIFEDEDQEPQIIQATIQLENPILQNKHAQKIMVTSDYLVTVGIHQEICIIELYPIEKNTQISPLLMSYKLPTRKIDPSENASSDLVLYCFYATETDMGIGDRNGSTFASKELYNQLFDMEANMAGVPLLLVALPSGQIYSIPVNFTNFKSRPKLLCDLQQPVVGIHGVSEKKSAIAESVLLVGYHGKVLVLRPSEEGEEGWGVDYREFVVRGPVLCCEMVGGWMIYSTGRSVGVISVGRFKDKEQHQCLETEQLTTGRILSLAPTISAPKAGTPKPNLEWLALNKNGWIYKYKLDLSDEVKEDTESRSNMGTHTLRDLLQGMAVTTDHLTTTQEEIAAVDGVLAQLALTGYILATSHLDPSNCPLSLHTKTEQENMGAYFKITLKITLTNQSPVKLSPDWILIVNLSNLIGIEKNSSREISKSVRLSELGPNEYQEIHLEITEDVLVKMPLRLQTSLCYDFKGALPGRLLSGGEELLALPLADLVVDILNTLQPRSGKVMGQVVTRNKQGEKMVEEMAKKRACAALHEDVVSSEAGRITIAESLTLTVKKEEIKKEMLKTYGKVGPSPLLAYLLGGSAVEVAAGETSLRAQSLLRSSLVLLSLTEPKKGLLEVRLESSHLQSLVQLNMAITQRLEKLRGSRSVDNSTSARRKLKDIENEASFLRDELCERKQVSRDFLEKVINLYTKLRSSPN